MTRSGVLPILLILRTTLASCLACSLTLTQAERCERANAIARCTVLHARSFRKSGETNAIYTDTILRVDEVFKGQFPRTVRIRHRGGRVGNEGQTDSLSPRFAPGQSRLLYLERLDDGSLTTLQAGGGAMELRTAPAGAEALTRTPEEAFIPQHELVLNHLREQFPDPAAAGDDVTDQAVDASTWPLGGLTPGIDGVSSRFAAPDKGEPLLYIVDMDALPVGVSSSAALAAVSNALSAWSEVTSATFLFDGIESFGRPAAEATSWDGKLCIQLHDLYNSITEPLTLGRGGKVYRANASLFPGGGLGGKVGTNAFDEAYRGYVTLNHRSAALSTLSTLEEVLCHEIGHALSLAHSSEDSGETNSALAQALMYYQVHGDGRGCDPREWDIDTIQQIYPTNNTPPYGYGRVLDILTAVPQPSGTLGVNEIEINAYDRQGDSLAFALTNVSSNMGIFSTSSNRLCYVPNGLCRTLRADPASGLWYDRAYLLISDGSNVSAPVEVRVISYDADLAPIDGLPDAWATNYWANPLDSGGATNDYDADGFTNLDEWILGTDPTREASHLGITSFGGSTVVWPAKAYENYEVYGSTNLAEGFVLEMNPVTPTGTVGAVTLGSPVSPRAFFRIRKTP